MSDNKYKRGSEWRKWDLHVHTPFSHLNNGFGNNFDEYVKKLFKKAIEKQIAVIGITDYFCIDGYKKIKEDYLNNDIKLSELFTTEEIVQIKKRTLFPNIEFRLDTLVDGNRVNFHVIFSDNVSISDIEEYFLHELDFIYEGNPQSIDEKWKLKPSNLKTLGENLKKEHSEFSSYSDLFVGMKCAVVNHSQITELLINKKSKFEGKYILAVPSDEDLSQLSWNGQDHNIRKVYIQKSDILISSNAGTISWGLGKKHESTESYIEEFKSLKPCIWGSDSHDYEKLFEPNQNKHTWVKANPSFDGLKQIVYEPLERVKIQEIEPDSKNDYLIIDKVQFIDDDFFPEPLLLNQNLTAIIGGKSTGKSILLRNIAQSVDPTEVKNRLKEVGLNDYKAPIKGFTVSWRDNQINKKNEDSGVNKKIIYIPQSYLNRLVDKKEDKTSIDDIIKNVLEQEENVKVVFSQLQNKNREIEKTLHKTLRIFFIRRMI